MTSKTLLCFSILAAFVAAQEQSPAQPAPQAPAMLDQGSEPVPGRIPGTRRYNVTFGQRGFTLDAFREAIHAGRTHEDVQAIVRELQAKASAEYANFAADVRALGGDVVVEFWLINACTIEIAPQDLAKIGLLPNVLHVRPDLPTYPLAPVPVKTATNSSNHNADAVQVMGYAGTGYSLAVVDTGQDSNMAGSGKPHVQYYRNANKSDLSGGGLGGSLLYANKAVPGTIGADDTHGHGTGVTSITGASGWGNASGDKGHAHDAGKVGYSICVSSGSCSSSLSVEAQGWQMAAADRALYNIVAGNMSYGSSPNPIDVSQQAIDACALNADLLPVTSAGNSSSSTSGSSSTANGLAVAAITPNTKTVATFSSRGPLSGDPARFFPDIGACGVNTVMAARDNEAGNYTGSGTSMASPQVCGAATLIKSVRPASSARELKAMLLCNTESIAAQNPVAPYNSRNAYGMGFLRDDLTANSALKAGTVLTRKIGSTTVPNQHPLQVTNGQPVAIVVTWYRNNLAANTWSDLNLKVYNGATLIASSTDTRNLYEKVTFTAPLTGVVLVEVSAVSLDVASLDYSLASTHVFAEGVPSSYAHYGAACAGSTGTPGLSIAGNAVLGGSFGLKLAFAKPGSNAFLLFGASNPGLNLGALAPSCSVLSSGEVIAAAVTSASGQASVPVTVPNNPALRGGAFFNQYVVQDAVNPLGLVFSQGGKGVVGDF